VREAVRMMARSAFGLALWLACGPGATGGEPVVVPAASARELRAGQLVAAVKCTANPKQSYALYVPAAYTAERRWPMIYVLDPAARGSLPLEAMKDAAERYGFVLAGSNNSRNGPVQPALEALEAMWADTHGWLAIDDRRVYFAGFSGGARVASQIALACKCTQGLFLNGAGFGGPAPGRDAALPVFATVGTADFNFGEMVTLDAELERTGAPHCLRRFDGPHTWAPPEVWEDAFGWAAVLEMKDQRRQRDEAFIASELARSMARARKLEASGAPHLALEGYRAIARALQGLTDLAGVESRIAALKDSPAVRASAKRERADIEEETALSEGPKRAIVALRDGDDPSASWAAARGEAERLRRRLDREKRPDERRLLERAHAGVTALILETGGGYLRDRDLPRARRYFELATASAPDSTWARISLARCLAAQGDRAGAVRELQRASDAGASVADLPGRFLELASLAQDPAFLKVIGTAEIPDVDGGDNR